MQKLFLLCSALLLALVVCRSAPAQPFTDTPSPDNPAVATYDGGAFTLRNLEDYAAEVPKLQRAPRLVDGAIWRDHMCRELAKQVLFTSRALEANLHVQPELLRARNYFIQEWMGYALLRDNVVNKIQVDQNKLRAFYEAHKTDYFLSPTVYLRLIRTKDKAKAELAMKRVASGEPFEKVESEMSEANLRQRGKVLGPFPTTQSVSMIPPPPQVIMAANSMDPGKTTGPLFLNNNYFIVRTEAKTPPEQKKFEDVVEFVETRIRQQEGDDLTRRLVQELRNELMVQEDETVLDKPNSRPDDIMATIGLVAVPVHEYNDLGGRIRGPALGASKLEPTRVRQFIVPIIFHQAGLMRGYHERKDFQKALLFHDLRRFGQRALDMEADRRTPKVTEEEIRRQYMMARTTKDEHGHTLDNVPYEKARESIKDMLHQKKRGDTERLLQRQVVEGANFRMIRPVKTTRLTAFEAAVAARDAIPAGYRIRMISSVPAPGSPASDLTPTELTEAGRREKWVFSLFNEANTSDVKQIVWDQPGRMYDSTDYFLSSPLHMQWGGIWRFDTDALLRHGYDSGMVDFAAKFDNHVHINTRVELEWNGNAPAKSYIVYEMRPLGHTSEEVLTLRYSGESGSLSRKPLHECEPCEQMKRLMNEPI